MPKDLLVATGSAASPSTPNADVINEEHLAEKLGFDINDNSALEKTLFTCINEDNRALLLDIFEYYPSSTTILQILLTTTYPNRDNFYRHDQDIIADADELLGPSLENLNAIQIATLLGEEDLAIDILEFVTKVTDEIEARKVLYEFMGRVWGEGNTILHLASFMGMCELVTQLVELGAATSKGNNRKYKPVDCAGDDETRKVFETVEEVNPTKRKDLEKSPTAITDIMFARTRSSSNLVLDPVAPVKPPPHSYSGVKSEINQDSKTVVKNSSTDSLGTARPRAESDSKKTRSKPRSGTLSKEDKFQIRSLTRSNIKSGPSKSKKAVRFDPGTLLLHLCQHFDHSDYQKNQIYECLGLNSDGTGKFTLDVNNTYSFQQWLTPLHVASSHGHLDIVKLLVENAGAAVNIFDKEGWTPLHCACAEGHLDVIKYLCSCQGNIALPNEGIGKNWVYCLDGPIDLVPENDDGDKPEDVGLEGKETEILNILCDFKFKYPPPEREEEEEELIILDSKRKDSNPNADAPIELDEDYFANNLKRAPSKLRKNHHHHDDDDEISFEKKKQVPKVVSADKIVSKPSEPVLPQKEIAAHVPTKEPNKKALGKIELDFKAEAVVASESKPIVFTPVPDAKLVKPAIVQKDTLSVAKSVEISAPTVPSIEKINSSTHSDIAKHLESKPAAILPKPLITITDVYNTPDPVVSPFSNPTKENGIPSLNLTETNGGSHEPFPSALSPKLGGKPSSQDLDSPNRIKPRKGSWGRKDVVPKPLEGTQQNVGEQMKRPQLARRSSKSGGQRPPSITDPPGKLNPADQQAEEPDMKRILTVKERMAAFQQNQATSGSKR